MTDRLRFGRAPGEGLPEGFGDAAQPAASPLGEHPRQLPTSLRRVKTRQVKWKAFENGQFKSDADPSKGEAIGDQGFNSLEDDLERWRQDIDPATGLPRVTQNERELMEWSYQYDGSTHYLLVTYAE